MFAESPYASTPFASLGVGADVEVTVTGVYAVGVVGTVGVSTGQIL